MKILILLIGMLTIGALGVNAQENNGSGAKSTKYRLFPDFDKDVKKVNATEDKNARRAAPQNTTSTREQIFKDYKKQPAARSAKPSALKTGGAKLSSDSKAEPAPAKEEVKKPEIPLQEGQEPKEKPVTTPKTTPLSKQ